MDAKVCKRPAEQQTPERRQLFRDDDTNMSPSPAKVVSPPIKQPKKRARAAAKPKPKAKAAASTAKVEDMKEAEEGKCTVEGETGEGGESNDKGEEETKSMRDPSEKLKKWAFDTLTAAKGDPASWFHAQKLFEGVKQTEKSCLAKWTYWQNSMYWTTRRVGVLQKQTLGGNKTCAELWWWPLQAYRYSICCSGVIRSQLNCFEKHLPKTFRDLVQYLHVHDMHSWYACTSSDMCI